MTRRHIAEWFRQRLQGCSGPQRRRPATPRPLRIELLEDRLAPAQVSWTGAGDGINWSDPHNWSTGALPGPADDVLINTTSDTTIRFNLFGNNGIHSLQSENPLDFTGGSLAIAAPSAVDNTVSISGALMTLTVNDELNVRSLVHTAGTLNGSGTVEISDQWVWSDGQVGGSGPLGTGTILLDSSAQATLSGGFFSMVVGWTIQNDGTAVAVDGGFDLSGTAAWNNDPGSLLVLQGGARLGNFFAGPTSALNNQGVVDVETDPMHAGGIDIPLNNHGEVDVDGGTLILSGGGASTGNFSLGDGSVVDVHSNYTMNSGTTVNGTGTVQVDTFDTLTIAGNVRLPSLATGGNVLALGNLTVADLTQGGFSNVSGPGTITINDNWTWTEGNLIGPGRTVLNGTATISGGFFSMLQGRTVENRGTATVTDGGFDFNGNSVWYNKAGSTLLLEDSAALGNFFAGPAAEFNNAGLLAKEGSGTSHLGIPLVNIGTVTINSSSILQIDGNLNFIQGGFGSLQIDVGGTGAGVGYGQLNVGGTAYLNGNLTVHLVNGFTPSPGDMFQILAFGSRGTPPTDFVSIDLPPGLAALYSTHNLTLVGSQ